MLDKKWLEQNMDNPEVAMLALSGIQDMERQIPMFREVMDLYGRVVQYPQGRLWVESLPRIKDAWDGDLLDRKFRREMMREFMAHLRKRRVALLDMLEKLGDNG